MFGFCSISELPFSSLSIARSINQTSVWLIELDNVSIWIVEAP